jgi:hypothetical protein
VGAIAAGLAAALVLGLLPVPEALGRVIGLTLDLALASIAGLAVYLAWSRLVRLPELPRTVGLLRSALRSG